MENGNDGLKVNATIIGAISLLIVQLVGGVFWIANLGARVDQLERTRVEIHAANQAQFNSLGSRIDKMDNEGTRALSIVEDRQKTVMRRLEILESKSIK
jgi:hypothetical protein